MSLNVLFVVLLVGTTRGRKYNSLKEMLFQKLILSSIATLPLSSYQ